MYLDTNVFYNCYNPTEESKVAEWIIGETPPELTFLCSEWGIVEMFRALKKQVNLGVIDDEAANTALDFFLSDIQELIDDRKLKLVPVSLLLLKQAREHIMKLNLHSADAVHLATAIEEEADAFITFDRDFQKKDTHIPVLVPSQKDFQKRLESLS